MLNLTKGDKINLEKDNGSKLINFCVGANWGAIESKGLFGGTSKKAVDLDLSCVTLDGSGNQVDLVSFRKQTADGIKLSDDDTEGDLDGDDGLDNEVLTINLDRVKSNVESIYFILNSYSNIEFNKIPFASIRIYEGTEDRVDNVFASYEISNGPEFNGKTAIILSKLYKRNGQWKVETIGESTNSKNIDSVVSYIKSNLG